MAEKEFLLGNRARELLRYTNQATRVVSDDVSLTDVQKIIRRISELDDIREVRSACSQIIHATDRKKKEGFSRSKYRLYGEELRMIAKGIVRDIHSANNKHFATEYQEFRKTDKRKSPAYLMIAASGIPYTKRSRPFLSRSAAGSTAITKRSAATAMLQKPTIGFKEDTK